MTAPRRVLPGTTYLVTRRCAQRQFLLQPSAPTNGVFLYVLSVAAQRFGVQVHAFCVLSNHFHLVVTDPDARLPAFEQYLDSLVARCLNASLGRWESFWAPSSYSAVALLSPADIVDKAAYVLANPVAAGLVRRGRDWHGLWSPPERVGGEALSVDRPAGFFRPKGPMPASASLALCPPPGLTAEEFQVQLSAALAAREDAAVAQLQPHCPRFTALETAGAPPSPQRPASPEPRRRLRPALAARDKHARIQALALLVAFRRAYREAWVAFRRGVPDVLFPPGTYLLRVLHGVPCAAPG